MSVGERISQLRKAKNISQGQLAKALEVSRQAVSKWENDQTAPDSAKLIKLAELLDTDIEHLTTGRMSMGRRPPIVLKTVETVEKTVEKPVIQYIEKIVEKPVLVERIVEVEKTVTVEKPVIKKVYRTKYLRNPIELIGIGILGFLVGLIVGILL